MLLARLYPVSRHLLGAMFEIDLGQPLATDFSGSCRGQHEEAQCEPDNRSRSRRFDLLHQVRHFTVPGHPLPASR